MGFGTSTKTANELRKERDELRALGLKGELNGIDARRLAEVERELQIINFAMSGNLW